MPDDDIMITIRHKDGNTLRGTVQQVLDSHLAKGWTLIEGPELRKKTVLSEEYLDAAFTEAWGFRAKTRSAMERDNARMWFNQGVTAAPPANNVREELALALAIRKGSGASKYQSELLARQILPHLPPFQIGQEEPEPTLENLTQRVHEATKREIDRTFKEES